MYVLLHDKKKINDCYVHMSKRAQTGTNFVLAFNIAVRL